MNMKLLITLIITMVTTMGMRGEIKLLHGTHINARMGYSLGGSAPLNMPATIRGLNKFPLTPNLSVGVDFQRPLTGNWGVMVGPHFENKGMSVDAKVKNYHMEIVRGGEKLEGMFTGNVVTKVTQWMFTVPLQGSYNLGNLRLRCGPYVSILVKREFYGWAYDGYLRVGNPTGPKIEMGHTPDERGDYNFTSNMRRVQWGINAGGDLMLGRRLGVYADLSWGLTGVHKSNFTTIEQTLYPIYGSIGIIYKIK